MLRQETVIQDLYVCAGLNPDVMMIEYGSVCNNKHWFLLINGKIGSWHQITFYIFKHFILLHANPIPDFFFFISF